MVIQLQTLAMSAASDNTADGSDTSADSEKDERKVIYYVTDKVQQGQYIKLFKEQNMQAVIYRSQH